MPRHKAEMAGESSRRAEEKKRGKPIEKCTISGGVGSHLAAKR